MDDGLLLPMTVGLERYSNDAGEAHLTRPRYRSNPSIIQISDVVRLEDLPHPAGAELLRMRYGPSEVAIM